MKINKKRLRSSAVQVFIFTSLVMLTSCSGFLPDRSYIEEMNRESDPYLVPGKDFPVTSGDSGNAYRSQDEIKKRTPASARGAQKTKEEESLKLELAQKEADIPEELLGEYAKDKKYLPSDSDKLYYLSLSASERPGYINSKKQDMQADLGKSQDFIQKHSIHSSDLYLGMEKSQVVELWGKPSRVEIAGNPKNQNERWSFLEDGSLKQIYFENGKVQGWALDL